LTHGTPLDLLEEFEGLKGSRMAVATSATTTYKDHANLTPETPRLK